MAPPAEVFKISRKIKTAKSRAFVTFNIIILATLWQKIVPNGPQVQEFFVGRGYPEYGPNFENHQIRQYISLDVSDFYI